jgi:Recombinase
MPHFPPGVHLIGGQTSAITNRAQAATFYAPIIPLVMELRGQGLSLRGIARELERRGVPTRHEFGRWHARQVARVLARAGTVGVGRTPIETEVV